MNKKGLSKNFSFKKGNFNNLRNSFHDLEFTIQELFRVLNFCGYKGERKENTHTSRIHDVTHAIYATKSNYLISADSKFVDKCKAVYYYLREHNYKSVFDWAKDNNIDIDIDEWLKSDDWRKRREVAKQGYGLDILVHDSNWRIRL